MYAIAAGSGEALGASSACRCRGKGKADRRDVIKAPPGQRPFTEKQSSC